MVKTVLVIGEEFFPAHGARTILSMLGCDTLGPARDMNHALTLLDERMPHAAILDIELGPSYVFELADVLAGRRIPFGFVASGSLLGAIPERHGHRPVARKPFGINHIDHLLRGLRHGQPGGREESEQKGRTQ